MASSTIGDAGSAFVGERATLHSSRATLDSARRWATITRARATHRHAKATFDRARATARDEWSTFCHKRLPNNMPQSPLRRQPSFRHHPLNPCHGPSGVSHIIRMPSHT